MLTLLSFVGRAVAGGLIGAGVGLCVAHVCEKYVDYTIDQEVKRMVRDLKERGILDPLVIRL